MKVTQHNEIIDRAKARKDGVYSYQGYLYMVKNGFFKGYADPYGDVYLVVYGWHTKRGHCEPYQRKQKLKELLKQL